MRLFIAFPLTPGVEEKLAEIVAWMRQRGGPVKWVEPNNIHLTARFLGETPDSQALHLSAMMDEVARRHQPVSSTIQTLGGFPNIHRPRVIWLGLDRQADALAGIAEEVERRVQNLGFAPEPKAFKAHLTLGRVREGQKIGDQLDYLTTFKLDPIPVTFDRLVLFKSTLTPMGPIYERLHEAKLGA